MGATGDPRLWVFNGRSDLLGQVRKLPALSDTILTSQDLSISRQAITAPWALDEHRCKRERLEGRCHGVGSHAP